MESSLKMGWAAIACVGIGAPVQSAQAVEKAQLLATDGDSAVQKEMVRIAWNQFMGDLPYLRAANLKSSIYERGRIFLKFVDFVYSVLENYPKNFSAMSMPESERTPDQVMIPFLNETPFVRSIRSMYSRRVSFKSVVSEIENIVEISYPSLH